MIHQNVTLFHFFFATLRVEEFEQKSYRSLLDKDSKRWEDLAVWKQISVKYRAWYDEGDFVENDVLKGNFVF